MNRGTWMAIAVACCLPAAAFAQNSQLSSEWDARLNGWNCTSGNDYQRMQCAKNKFKSWCQQKLGELQAKVCPNSHPAVQALRRCLSRITAGQGIAAAAQIWDSTYPQVNSLQGSGYRGCRPNAQVSDGDGPTVTDGAPRQGRQQSGKQQGRQQQGRQQQSWQQQGRSAPKCLVNKVYTKASSCQCPAGSRRAPIGRAGGFRCSR